MLMAGSAWLDLRGPVAVARYRFRGILRERAEALLGDLDASATVRGRVEKLLAPTLHTQRVPGWQRSPAGWGFSRATLAPAAEGGSDDLRRRCRSGCADGSRSTI